MYNRHLLHCMVEVSLGSGHWPLQEETPLLLCPSSTYNRIEILEDQIRFEPNITLTALEKKKKKKKPEPR